MQNVQQDWKMWRLWLKGEVDADIGASWSTWNRFRMGLCMHENVVQKRGSPRIRCFAIRWLLTLTVPTSWPNAGASSSASATTTAGRRASGPHASW